MSEERTKARVVGIVATMLVVASLTALVSLPTRASAYTLHAPIVINGDSDFTPANGVISGSGTWNDPYIIEGWEIDASSATGIAIQNTDAHFIIRGVYVHSGGGAYDGIVFTRLNNGAVENSTVSDNHYGIFIDCTLGWYSNINITSSTITGNLGHGIYQDFLTGYSVNVNIISNEITHNSGDGIHFGSADAPYGTDGDRIISNNVSDNGGGIYLIRTGATVASNTITDNSAGTGVYFYRSGGDITSNVISGSSDGIRLEGDGGSKVDSNTITNIAYNGIVVARFSNNVEITSNEITNTSYGVSIWSSHNTDINSNRISNSYYGVFLTAWAPMSSNDGTKIDSNTIVNNSEGIRLESSFKVDITANTVSRNGIGISLPYDLGVGPPDTMIWLTSNNVSNNSMDGISLDRSTNVTIADNDVVGNLQHGFFLQACANNTIFHNNIADNSIQAHDDMGGENAWDDGYPSGGNYWSDYAGVDFFNGPNQDIPGSDGIGDTPYVIDANSSDRYPLGGSQIPAVSITSPPSGAWYNTTVVTIAGAAAGTGGGGLDRVEVSCDGGSSWHIATGTAIWTYDCSGLVEGSNAIHAKAFDLAGSESSHKSITVNVDLTPPTVTITSPPDGAWVNTTTVTISGTAADTGGSGLDRVEVSCDNGATWHVAIGTATWTYDCAGPVEGGNAIHARAFDVAGSQSTHDTITVNVDSTAPAVAITSPADNAWFDTSTVTVTGMAADTGSGLDRVEVSCDNRATWNLALGTATWTYNCIGLSEGANVIHVRAFDLFGWESAQDFITINVDLTLPVVTISSPPDGAWVNTTTVTISGTASDGGSGLDRVEVSCDGGTTWHEATGTATWTYDCVGLVEGTNAIHARAFDIVGWESVHDTITVNVDLTPPTVSISDPANDTTVGSPALTISGIAVDNLGISVVKVRVGAGGWGDATGTTSWITGATLFPRYDIIEVQAFDMAGNPSSLASINIFYDNEKPSITLTCDRITVEAGTTVHCTVTAADNRGTPTVSWTVAKDGITIASGAGLAVTFIANKTGDYTIEATATDSVGNSEVASQIVTATAAPKEKPVDVFWLLVSIIVVAAAVIGLLLFFLMRRRKKEARAPEEELPGQLIAEEEKEELDKSA